jgi:hypothetical protein
MRLALFSREDRELFFVYERSLRPEHLAVKRPTECVDGNPNAFYDALLRDKIDDLVFQQVLGVERREQYRRLFDHAFT